MVINITMTILDRFQNSWAGYAEIFLLLIMGILFAYGPLIVWQCAKNAKTKSGYNLSKFISGAIPILTVVGQNADPALSGIAVRLSFIVLLIGVCYLSLIFLKSHITDFNKEKIDSIAIPILIFVASMLAWFVVVVHALNL